jgi:hypothetical protein
VKHIKSSAFLLNALNIEWITAGKVAGSGKESRLQSGKSAHRHRGQSGELRPNG